MASRKNALYRQGRGQRYYKETYQRHANDRDESNSGKQTFWEKNYMNQGETVVYTYAKHADDLHNIRYFYT